MAALEDDLEDERGGAYARSFARPLTRSLRMEIAGSDMGDETGAAGAGADETPSRIRKRDTQSRVGVVRQITFDAP